MSRLKDYPIGCIIVYEGTTLTVTAQKGNIPSCGGCYFSNVAQAKRHKKIACYLHGLACTAFKRKDKQHVIFSESV